MSAGNVFCPSGWLPFAGFLKQLFLLFCLGLPNFLSGQENRAKPDINGAVNHVFGWFSPEVENSVDSPGLMYRSNSRAQLYLRYRNLQAGFRYEAYLPPLPGYDPGYKGHGLASLWGMFAKPRYSLTLGSFYEQFGSGLILRAYENQQLGIDNALVGIKCSLIPVTGFLVKAFIGRQRQFWSLGEGVVKGVDGEWNFSDTWGKSSGNQLIAGVSMVSRYQDDNDPLYRLPENVAAFSGRLSYSGTGFQLSGEYGYKINDPSAINNLIYKDGQALILTGSFSSGSLGILLTGKWVDNMDFRSNRDATGNNLTIGFMPGVPAEHSYALAAMYPYVAQLSGEAALHSEINWTLEKGSPWGGRWGTTLTFRSALSQSIRKEPANPDFPAGIPGTSGYRTSFLALGETKYFREISVEVSRRISQTMKGIVGFNRLFYNISALQGHPGAADVTATTLFADLSFRISPRKSLRTELQHLFSRMDKGSWAMALLEYSPSPGWILGLSDQYNYGNHIETGKKHYLLLNLAYNKNAHHLNFALGRQKEGVVCVGGVCRYTPEYSGFTLSYTLTFY